MEILIAGLVLAGLGLLFGLGLAFASKVFSPKLDKKLEMILELLSEANCGACGKAGCLGFAEAILSGELDISACKVSSEEAKEKISKILNKEFKKTQKVVAVLHCNGKDVKDRFVYDGIKTCKHANLVLGGQKSCIWGCLGFGDCVMVCPFGAISMKDNLPKVDINKCTGCGKCIEACPKKLFSLIPVNCGFYIACSSHSSSKDTKAVCNVGCISCGICVKVAPSIFYLDDNLSCIDYKKIEKENLKLLEEAKQKCPVKCILKI